jgi:hypothetical protein
VTAPVSPWWTRITRDLVLFVSGLVIIFYIVLTGDRREFVAVLAAGMCGLPVFLRKDESNR